MVYYDDILREDWLAMPQMHRRIPALLHVIAERPFWKSGELYDAICQQGYRMTYKSFQRDIDFCQMLGFVDREVNMMVQGRTSHISIRRDAFQLLRAAKIPSKIPSKLH